jgi:hypothetical protein
VAPITRDDIDEDFGDQINRRRSSNGMKRRSRCVRDAA